MAAAEGFSRQDFVDRILAFVRQQAQNGTGALTVKSGGTLEISSGTMTFDSLTVGR